MLLANGVILAFKTGRIGAIVTIAIFRIDGHLLLFPLLALLLFFALLIFASHATDGRACRGTLTGVSGDRANSYRAATPVPQRRATRLTP